MPCINHTQTMGESAPPQRRSSLVQHLSYYCPALLASRHRDESCSASSDGERNGRRSSGRHPPWTLGAHIRKEGKRNHESGRYHFTLRSRSISILEEWDTRNGKESWKERTAWRRFPAWKAQRGILSPPPPFPLIYCSLVIRIVTFFVSLTFSYF